MREWNMNVFGNIFQAHKAVEQRLAEIQNEFIHRGSMDILQVEEEILKKQIEERQH
jgi:hypothetical protein